MKKGKNLVQMAKLEAGSSIVMRIDDEYSSSEFAVFHLHQSFLHLLQGQSV
jgi:hypothetical protein